jgi:hypothetical protein
VAAKGTRVINQVLQIPNYIRPMLCTLASKPFDDPNWIFEPKFDGVTERLKIGHLWAPSN